MSFGTIKTQNYILAPLLTSAMGLDKLYKVDEPQLPHL